jgi:hypothetical protein
VTAGSNLLVLKGADFVAGVRAEIDGQPHDTLVVSEQELRVQFAQGKRPPAGQHKVVVVRGDDPSVRSNEITVDFQ